MKVGIPTEGGESLCQSGSGKGYGVEKEKEYNANL